MIADNNLISDKSSEDSLSYMPQLDTLRAFAVLFVLIEHWIINETHYTTIPFGMIGVTTFFVLSGFLITEILLRSRNIAEENNLGLLHSLKQFYIRRTLRIFPIYYITIFILFVFNIQSIREIFIWFFTYTSNIYFFSIQNWAGSLSHLWTLAVEEQFYIFWPLIILFIPKNKLLKAITGIIIFAILFRGLMFLMSDKSENAVSFISILTPSCLDSFGLGALLAYFRMNNNKFKFSSFKANVFLIFNIVLISVLLMFEENLISASVFKFNVSVIALFFISKISIGFTGFMKLIFENKLLMYLGKISYGLYLFHNFIPMIYRSTGLTFINNIYIKFLIQFILMIIIATVSWFVLEKPINNLKKRFAYN